MRANKWSAEKLSSAIALPSTGASEEVVSETEDLETLGMDQIGRLISARFKGHAFTRLVDAVLRA